MDVTSAPGTSSMPLVSPVHTAVPGRARFAVTGLYRDDARAQMLERQLRRHPGIVSASASPLAGKVLVCFDSALGLEQVQACVEETFARAERSQSMAGNGGGAEPNVLAGLPGDDGPSWHCVPAKEAVASLESSPETGLRQAVAAERLERLGPNRLPGIATRSGLAILAEQFNRVPVALLGVSAALALVTGGILEALAIGCVIGLNAAIGEASESEAERTINALTDDERPPATVIRSGRRRRAPAEEVVPGDVIELTPGTVVAADARLIEADRLSVDEFPLTGESLPVPKGTASLRKKVVPVAARSNLVFMGTTVAGGSGRARRRDRRPHPAGSDQHDGRGGACADDALAATARGARAQAGHAVLGRLRRGVRRRPTPRLRPLAHDQVLDLACYRGRSRRSADRRDDHAGSLGIGAMRRHKVLIRQLSAVETLGALQMICFDKTGTITFDKMKAVSISNGPNGPSDPAELLTLLKVGVLCSDAAIREAEGTYVVDGSPTETALVQLAVLDPIDADHHVERIGRRVRALRGRR